MGRIKLFCNWAFAGTLLMLAVMLPAILQPAGNWVITDYKDVASPQVASFSDYEYTIGVTGVAGIDNAHFNNTMGVAVNGTGHLYVADMYNHRVQVFDKTATYQYTICGNGAGSDNDQFNEPRGVAVNGTGHLYVVDTYNHRVQVFDNAGIYQYSIGGGSPFPDNQHFNHPRGVAVNATGDVFVTDSDFYRVMVFDNAGRYKYHIGETWVDGGDNSHFNYPQGIAVNDSGCIYVGDQINGRIQVFDNAGNYLRTLDFYAEEIAVNATGHLFRSSLTAVYVYNSDGVNEYTLGTPGIFGSDNSHFNGPYGVAVNSTGHLYVADSDNHRVQVFTNGTPSNLTLKVNGGATHTSSLSVTLDLSGNHAIEMCLSNNGSTYTDWEAYSTSKIWTLEDGLGPKTVYFLARNARGESGPVIACITYTLPPSDLSITIDDGAAETGSTSVTLTLSASGATEMCFSNNGIAYSGWGAYNTVKTWAISNSPGIKTVYFKARNGTIEATAPVTDTILYVKPPDGLSIQIEGGAIDTSTLNVIMILSATGATEMCFSNNGSTYTNWETYFPAKTWVLTGGPGVKTVYFNARNSTFEAAAPVADTISYTLPPTGLSITIDGGDVETESTSVMLTLSATGATEMCFSNNGTTYTTWEAYDTSKAWTLDAISGLRTVYFKTRNSTIEAAAPAMDTITYVGPPSDLSIKINGGAAETSTLAVTLTLSATGATEMSFSNDGVTWSAWEPYATTKEWSLEGDAGPKNVYFKVRNSYHEAAPVYETIIYKPGGISGFPVFVLVAFIGVSLLYTARRLRSVSRA